MLKKLVGGLVLAAGLIVAGVAATSADTTSAVRPEGTCCSKGAACCSEDECPDCKCQSACRENCEDGCECPNKP